MHRAEDRRLIRAAVLLGALPAPLSADERANLDRFAKRAGLLFQVVDDILDCTASTATLGKTAGRTKPTNRPTSPARPRKGVAPAADELRTDARDACPFRRTRLPT